MQEFFELRQTVFLSDELQRVVTTAELSRATVEVANQGRFNILSAREGGLHDASQKLRLDTTQILICRNTKRKTKYLDEAIIALDAAKIVLDKGLEDGNPEAVQEVAVSLGLKR